MRVLLLIALLASPAWGQANTPLPEWSTSDLADLGLSDSMREYATQSALSFWFFARQDEVLTDAKVRLEFARDLTLFRELESVQILLNDEPIAEIPAAALLADRNPLVPLDSRLLSSKNSLTLRLVGPNPQGCASQVHAGAWRILDAGYVDTMGRPLPLPDDLGILPLPFLDDRRDREGTVHIVFPEQPGEAELESAAAIASWLGTRTSAPVTFVVHVGVLPEASAIVFATGEVGFDLLAAEASPGPSVRILDHPRYPGINRKLLLVQGRDAIELLSAARNLALGKAELTGPEVGFDGPAIDPPRRPYDSPRWLPANQIVYFDQITGGEQLVHKGLDGGTLELTFRVAPDLFTWPADKVQLSVDYNHLAPTSEFVPRLTVELNGEYVGSLERPRVVNGLAAGSEILEVHRSWLRGFNRLQFHVSWPELTTPCGEQDSLGGGLETTISGGSAIHLEDVPHFSRLPDVAQFVDDGFPFTRFADLAATALVLPDEPAPEDIGTLLSLLTHFAGVTGYPVARAPILFEGQLSEATAGGRDLLVVGNVDSLRLLKHWAERLPLLNIRGRLLPRQPTLTERALALIGGQLVDRDSQEASEVISRSVETAAVLGLESPISPGRSALVVTATAAAAMPDAGALVGFTLARRAGGDLLLVDSRKGRSRFRIGPQYDVGTLDRFTKLRWVSANHWLVLIPAIMLIGLLLAAHAKARLLRRHWERLNPGEDEP